MISVALTTYNGKRFLPDQINSILGQSIPDFELIVCDDCSTDDTWKVLKEFHKKDSRVHIYRNEQNVGFRDNFLKAISLCGGDYVALCDQDDIWTDNHLELLLNSIGDNMLACGNSLLVDENNVELGMTLLQQEGISHLPTKNLDIARMILLNHNPFQGASMMFRKEFLEIALPMPKQANYHDVWFAVLASFMDSFVYIKTPIVRYRMHGNNVSGEHQMKKPQAALLQLVRSHYVGNRPDLLAAIEERGVLKTKEQLEYGKAIKRYFHNARSKYTKLLNFPFIIANFRSITTI